MFRAFRTITVATLAGVVFSVHGSTPASASDALIYEAKSSSWPSAYTASAEGTGVAVRWVANGDKLYVKDTKKDGRRAGAVLIMTGSGGVVVLCENTLGAGSAGLCNLALTENREIDVYAATCDADTTNCTNEDNWTVVRGGGVQTHT